MSTDRTKLLRRHQSRTGSASADSSKKGRSLAEIENLFVEKLSEKYDLTERGIQKAFKKFDTDGSGHLSVPELSHAINLFVNGIDPAQIQELVRIYDVDGDGQISIEEFTSFLMSRTSQNKDDWITVDQIMSNSGASTARPTSASSTRDLSFEIDNTEPTTTGVEYRTRVFLKNMRAMLIKRSMELRLERKIPIDDRLTNHINPLAEQTARVLLAKEFRPFVTSSASSSRVDISAFSRVLNKFVYPGAAPPREDVIQFLFEQCDGSLNGREVTKRCDPDILIDLIFEKSTTVVNKFGFGKEIPANTDIGRPEIGRGLLERPSNNTKVAISSVPQRFLTARSRTGIAVPSEFDPRLLDRSAEVPSFTPSRSHVIGLTINVNSGHMVHSIVGPRRSMNMIVYASAALGIVHDLDSNRQKYFDGHDDDVTCITLSRDSRLAATGQTGKRCRVMVWETQLSSTVTTRGTHANQGEIRGLVSIIGTGFFARAVCAVEFSHDNKFICAISCDDKHEMGIWSIALGELMVSASAANGVPPQVKCIRWSPRAMDTSNISQEHADADCDVICTVGERQLKFWSFKRPSRHDRGQLLWRSHRMGKCKADAAKVFTCADFITTSAGDLIVTSGDNGYVYMWRDCVCIGAVEAIKGGVDALRCVGTSIICSGAKGLVVILDGENLTTRASFCVLPNQLSASGSAGMSSASSEVSITPRSTASTVSARTPRRSARPASAGHQRPGSRSGTSSSNPGQHSSGASAILESRATAVAGATSNRAPSSKRQGLAPKSAWGGIGDVEKLEIPSGVKGSAHALGFALITDPNNPDHVSSIIVATGFGRLMEIDLGSQAISTTSYYHYGPLWALAVSKTSRSNIIATSGDDKWICLWNATTKALETRALAPAPVRCLDFDNRRSTYLAVGTVAGMVLIYEIESTKRSDDKAGGKAFMRNNDFSPSLTLKLLAKDHTSREDISDIKFSPSGNYLASGSHDNYIYIYTCRLTSETLQHASSCELKLVKRLKGHSSFLTHLDWSLDERLLRSTCGAYETLFWDVAKGKQYLSSIDTVESDTQWHTDTCIFGFPVMAIWPRDCDGTDINAVDVSRHFQLVATGDDFGQVKVFNYPCIAKNAPFIAMDGHSSHVMNVKFVRSDDNHKAKLASVGGNDNSVMLWELTSK